MLSRFKEHESAAMLEKIARTDPATDVRIQAMAKLAQAGKQKALPVLKELYQDSNLAIRLAAALQLAKLGDPIGYELAKKSLTHESRLIRMTAASIVGYAGSSADKKLLNDIANSKGESGSVKSRAAYSLKELEFRGLSENERLPFLKDALSARRQAVRVWASRKLYERRDAGALEILDDASKQTAHPGRREAGQALAAIMSEP